MFDISGFFWGGWASEGWLRSRDAQDLSDLHASGIHPGVGFKEGVHPDAIFSGDDGGGFAGANGVGF